MMANRTLRRVSLGATVVVGAALLVAVPSVGRWQQAAHAEQIRTRAVRVLVAKRSWRVHIVETETGTDGKRSVMREQLTVRRSGEYRLALSETDEQGRAVVSTTIRTKGALYTRRTGGDGGRVLHVMKGVRPSLGIEFDNALGQTVQAVADAHPLKVVGRERKNGRIAEKLELGAGHFVWIDRDSGFPVEEQVISGTTVAHDVVFSDLVADVPVADSVFDAGSLGDTRTAVVEDLGFRDAASTKTAATTLGFVPLDVPAPSGFALAEQGFVDPRVPNGDAPAEASFVSLFTRATEGVLVTQVLRTGLGDSVPQTADAEPDAPETITVGDKPALFYQDAARQQLVLVRRDVLVTIEGTLPESSMREFAERIR